MQNKRCWQILALPVSCLVFLPLAAEETQAEPVPAEAAPAAPVASAAPADKEGAAPANAADWQTKVDTQANKAAAKPAEATMDASAETLAKAVETQLQLVVTSRAGNTPADYFKAQWQLLRLLPELSYKPGAMRDAMGKSNTDLKAWLTANNDTLTSLSGLYKRFDQRLGLRGVALDVPKRRTVSSTAPATGTAATTDIALDTDPAKAPLAMTDAERYKLTALEQYLKRLVVFAERHDMAGSESDWKGAAKNLEGAYFFQVWVKQDPRVGATYPATLKFLRSIDPGIDANLSNDGSQDPGTADTTGTDPATANPTATANGAGTPGTGVTGPGIKSGGGGPARGGGGGKHGR